MLAQPMYWSSKTASVMTDAEVDQVLKHNELGEKLCGWKAAKS